MTKPQIHIVYFPDFRIVSNRGAVFIELNGSPTTDAAGESRWREAVPIKKITALLPRDFHQRVFEALAGPWSKATQQSGGREDEDDDGIPVAADPYGVLPPSQRVSGRAPNPVAPPTGGEPDDEDDGGEPDVVSDQAIWEAQARSFLVEHFDLPLRADAPWSELAPALERHDSSGEEPVKFPDIGCDESCGITPAGVGFACTEGRACGRYFHTDDKHFVQIRAYHAAYAQEGR